MYQAQSWGPLIELVKADLQPSARRDKARCCLPVACLFRCSRLLSGRVWVRGQDQDQTATVEAITELSSFASRATTSKSSVCSRSAYLEAFLDAGEVKLHRSELCSTAAGHTSHMLPDRGSCPPQTTVKERYKALNAAIAAIHESQSGWTVPDATLRANLKACSRKAAGSGATIPRAADFRASAVLFACCKACSVGKVVAYGP